MKHEHPLSPREQQMLNLAAEGLTDVAIAHKLGISEATVSTYWGRVRQKLGPYNRTELVAMAIREEGERALAALKERNAELLEDLRKAKLDPLGVGMDFYFNLFESAPDAIVVCDDCGRVVELNSRAAELFGYERKELQGQHISMLIPERFHARHREHISAYMRCPERRRMGPHMATYARHKTGREFLIAGALSTMSAPEGVLVTCVVRDLTEQQALENLLHRLASNQ